MDDRVPLRRRRLLAGVAGLALTGSLAGCTGDDGYANWWQVERLDGSRLGRRDLLHAHSQQPFTRSETIDVPDDVTCVVVRGHDQTHEYGGVAMLVKRDGNLVTGTGVTFIVPDYVV